MPLHRSSAWLAAVLAFAGTGLLSDEALARECATSADCPTDFVCAPTGTGPGGATTSTCVSGQCQSDSDCGAGFRCLFALGTICTNGADGGQDCHPNNVCTPEWEVPCTEDSQCGPGFTCANDGGSAAPNPAATVAPGVAVVHCGADRFDASIPSYATATWIPCEDVPLPPFQQLCDGGNDDAEPRCIPLCQPGSMCLSVSAHACSGPASGQSCRSAADCPQSWSCGCPASCTTGIVLPPDAGPIPDASCETLCIPPNADLSPDYGECSGPGFAASPGPSNVGLDAGSSTQPTTGGGSTPSGGVPVHGSGATSGPSSGPNQGGCQSASGDASGSAAWLLAIALGALTRVRRRRAQP